MNFRVIFLVIISISAIFLTACGGSEQTTNNTVSVNSVNNANNPANNSNNQFVTNKKEDAPTTNNAPTLAPVVAAYYDALKKKDEAALRKVLSADFIKTLEADMKEEGKKSLIEYIVETDKVPEKPVEVRNEKIEGDRATAELKGGMNTNWTAYVFVKENGAWKMTNEFPDVTNVKNSANTSSNTTK